MGPLLEKDRQQGLVNLRRNLYRPYSFVDENLNRNSGEVDDAAVIEEQIGRYSPTKSIRLPTSVLPSLAALITAVPMTAYGSGRVKTGPKLTQVVKLTLPHAARLTFGL